MAGHVITLYLREHGYNVATLSGSSLLDDRTVVLDVSNSDKLLEYLKSNSFDVVINCIGVLVKASEEYKDRAVYLNSYLPHFLEQFYKDMPTKVIHLSTDCVFSGKNPPYTEDSWPEGNLFYDRTKALGEIVNDKDLTFRMSIIGPDMKKNGVGLFNWFMSQTGMINGYKKSIWTGVTTIELARAISAAISQNLTGLYHLVPSENISKYDLLTLIKDAFSRTDLELVPIDGIALDKTLINTRTDFDFSVQDYTHMVDDMRDWVQSHKRYYPHYE